MSEIPPQQPFTDIPSSASYPPAGSYPSAGSYPPPTAPTSSGLSDNAAGALAYVTIVPPIVFLVMEPYNRNLFVKFHSLQSLGLAVAWFAVWFAIMILQIVLHAIPLIGILFLLLHLVVALGFFIAWIMCILKASQGLWFKLPFLGDFAEKQARS